VVVSWSRPGPSITVEGRRVVTGRLALEGARRLALGDHVVDVGSRSWGGRRRRRGEDAGVQLDEALQALEEQVGEAAGHVHYWCVGARYDDTCC
jgi:hypothetical protein